MIKFVTLFFVAVVIFATPASAARCRVMDPTGTLLNVRSEPNGARLGELPNGVVVTSIDMVLDGRGRAWAYVVDREMGTAIGWVWREFLACF